MSIAGENAAVDEGENVVFTVTRTGGKDLNVFTVRVNVYEVRDSLPWQYNEEKLAEFVEIEEGNGFNRINGIRSLYSENQYDVQFAAGSATATITIPTEDESYNDGNSYFRADIPLSGNYQVDPFPGRAEVWVRDDDIPTVHVTPENYTVVEDRGLPDGTHLLSHRRYVHVVVGKFRKLRTGTFCGWTRPVSR